MLSLNKQILSLIFFVIAFTINQASFAENVVKVGKNNFLEVDGKPIFVIGAYDLPKDMSLSEGKSMGFDLIRSSADMEKWDKAHELGLYVWHSFGRYLDLESGNQRDKKIHIKHTVEKFKQHSALLYWESMDEPAWTNKKPAQARATPESLAKGYRYLRLLDSNHPVYLNHAPRNTVKTLKQYNDACNIVCADIYPIIPHGMPETTYAITPDGRHGDLPNQTPSCVGEYVDKMKQAAEPNQAVFIVLQGFSWEEASRKETANEDLILYPSYRESRFMAYNAIIHGVNGILYWGLHSVEKYYPFVQDLSRVLNELQDIKHVFLAEDVEKPVLNYHERGSTIAAGIEMLCKKIEEGVYIIAANTSIDPAAVDFTQLPSELDSVDTLNVLGETRSVSIKDGSFFDEFEGLGVHVYTTVE